ncbi:MAG: Ig-like domain-containing protein, partial [Acidimicrobiales bacterium]
MDLAGRKMYVLGDRLAEVIDLDTKAYTDLSSKPWAVNFPGLDGTYLAGPGVSWHARTRQIVAWTGGQNLLLIDPATGVAKTVAMGGVTVSAAPSAGTYGRFRVIPGTDQVVLVNSVYENVFIGTVPFGGGTPLPPLPPPPPPPPPPPTGDTVPPSVSVTVPPSPVAGTFNAVVTATDNVGVTTISLYLDGVKLHGPFPNAGNATIPINSTSLTNGAHTVQARASDAAGNQGVSSTVGFTVSNASSPPPPAPVPTQPPTPPPTPTPTPTPPPTGDTVPPSVSVTVPPSPVAGTFNAVVTATDNVGVTTISLYLDGVK